MKKRETITSAAEDVEKLESSYIAGAIAIKWYNHFGKQFGNTSKIKYRVTI